MAGARRGAIVVRELFSRDGKTAELERLLVYSVKDGLLLDCRVYDPATSRWWICSSRTERKP